MGSRNGWFGTQIVTVEPNKKNILSWVRAPGRIFIPGGLEVWVTYRRAHVQNGKGWLFHHIPHEIHVWYLYFASFGWFLGYINEVGKYEIHLQVAVSPYIHPYTHTIHVRPAGTGVVVVVDWLFFKLHLHLFPTPLAASKEIRGTDSDPFRDFCEARWRKFCGSGWDDGKKTEVMENHRKKNSIRKKTWKQIWRFAGVCMWFVFSHT